jgi:hypothetical protein
VIFVLVDVEHEEDGLSGCRLVDAKRGSGRSAGSDAAILDHMGLGTDHDRYLNHHFLACWKELNPAGAKNRRLLSLMRGTAII